MESLNLDLTKILVWILFSNIPLELFSRLGISYIASTVGIPLYHDKFTTNQEKLSFARVCVEVDIDMEIPKDIKVLLKDENIVHVFTDVAWMP